MATYKYGLSTPVLKSALSAGVLTGVKYYRGEKLNKETLMPAGYQFISSYVAQDVENILRPLLPPALQVQSMYLKPLIVGGLYSIISKVVDGNKKYMANFLISAGSEVGATFIEPYFEGAVGNSILPPANNSLIPPPSNSLSRTLG